MRLAQAMRHPIVSLEKLSYRLLCTIGHRNYKRFIVLSRSRTGSNMLLSFLNAHPNLRADGEVFSKLNGRRYRDILDKVFSKQPYYVAAKGFKIFYYHPLDAESSELWRDLKELDDLRVIHLKRRNILRTLNSRKVAGIQGIWRLPSSQSLSRSGSAAVTFTAAELEEGFNETRRWEEQGDKMFESHPLLAVNYEDLIDSPEATFRRITDLLGVHYVRPRTNLRKQNAGRLRDLVTNYDELKAAFGNTEWQSFFDE